MVCLRGGINAGKSEKLTLFYINQFRYKFDIIKFILGIAHFDIFGHIYTIVL